MVMEEMEYKEVEVRIERGIGGGGRGILCGAIGGVGGVREEEKVEMKAEKGRWKKQS